MFKSVTGPATHHAMPTKKQKNPKPATGAAPGARREIDDDHIYLLACNEIGGA
ncbi:unnamed protein product [Penicillium salamii]|nr:unnamed protein product [Penicillium salamii]